MSGTVMQKVVEINTGTITPRSFAVRLT